MGFPPKDERDLTSYTVKLPRAHIAALYVVAPRLGISAAEFSRQAIAEKLHRHQHDHAAGGTEPARKADSRGTDAEDADESQAAG